MAILSEKQIAADGELPDTGIGMELERKLSPIFINMDGYGTRSSTALLIDRHGRVQFEERSFDERGEMSNTAAFEFVIKKRGTD